MKLETIIYILDIIAYCSQLCGILIFAISLFNELYVNNHKGFLYMALGTFAFFLSNCLVGESLFTIVFNLFLTATYVFVYRHLKK